MAPINLPSHKNKQKQEDNEGELYFEKKNSAQLVLHFCSF